MKKFLLSLVSLTLMNGAVIAQEANVETLPELVIISVSANGQWAVSENTYGSYQIYNIGTGELSPGYVTAEGDAFRGAIGYAISNDGVALANQDPYYSDASYWEKGEWKYLPLPDGIEITGNSANGISSDGKYICGYVENPNYGISTPVVWTRKDDGTYNLPEFLPFPEKDFAGLRPQYVTVNYISDEGNVAAGMMTDDSGFMHIPLIYKKNAEGTWSYEIFGYKELYHADELTLPPYPGGEPEGRPEATDFMTEEQYNQYAADYEAYSKGYIDWPDPVSYLTDEQAETYNRAMEVYDKKLQTWEAKYYPWLEAYQKYIATAPEFIMNQYRLSRNGRYFVVSLNAYDGDILDSFYGAMLPQVVFCDLATNEIKVFNDELGVNASQINNDGTILGATPLNDYVRTAYICLPGTDRWIPLEEYYKTKSPELADWITEYLTVEIPTYVEDENGNYVETTKKMVVSGTPYGSEDLSVITGWTLNGWDENDPTYFYTFVYKTAEYTGVEDLEIDAVENVSPVYYNLQGVRIDKPQKGIYIVTRGNKVSKEYIK